MTEWESVFHLHVVLLADDLSVSPGQTRADCRNRLADPLTSSILHHHIKSEGERLIILEIMKRITAPSHRSGMPRVERWSVERWCYLVVGEAGIVRSPEGGEAIHIEGADGVTAA